MSKKHALTIIAFCALMVSFVFLVGCVKRVDLEKQNAADKQRILLQAGVDFERLKNVVATCDAHGGLASYKFQTQMSEPDYLQLHCADGVVAIFR